LVLAVVPALLSRVYGTLDKDKKRALSHAQAVRYASAASLPLAASGWIIALPTLTTTYLALALLCALAYRTGSLGARVFLERTGFDRTLIAALTCLVAALPSLLAAPLCGMH